jgi:hypothetical protein
MLYSHSQFVFCYGWSNSLILFYFLTPPTTARCAPLEPPKPAYKKWSLKKEIDPQLVSAIVEIGDRLGTDYTAGNYQIQIHAPQREIEVKYKHEVAMIVYPSTCEALLIDHTYTIKQFEWGLRKSIDILVTQEQQPQADLQLEQREPERSEPMQPELELPHEIIIIEDSEIIDDYERIIIDDPKIDTKLLINKNLSRKRLNEIE